MDCERAPLGPANLFLNVRFPPFHEGNDYRCRALLSEFMVDRSNEMLKSKTLEIPQWSDRMRWMANHFTEKDVNVLYSRLMEMGLAKVFRSFPPHGGTNLVHHRMFIDFLVLCEHFFNAGVDKHKQFFCEKGRKISHKMLWKILKSPKDLLSFAVQRNERHKELRDQPKSPMGMGFRKCLTRWYLKHNPLKLLLECTRQKRQKSLSHARLITRAHVVNTATTLMNKELPDGISEQQRELFKLLQAKKIKLEDVTDPELKTVVENLSTAATTAAKPHSMDEAQRKNSRESVEKLLEAGLKPEHILSHLHNKKHQKVTSSQREKWRAIQAFRSMVYEVYLARANFIEIFNFMPKIHKSEVLGEVAFKAIMSWSGDGDKIKDLTPLVAWNLVLFVRDFRRWRIRWRLSGNNEGSHASMARLERGDMHPAFKMFE